MRTRGDFESACQRNDLSSGQAAKTLRALSALKDASLQNCKARAFAKACGSEVLGTFDRGSEMGLSGDSVEYEGAMPAGCASSVRFGDPLAEASRHSFFLCGHSQAG